jgi:GDPmannose 4,6-dehydratase
LKKAFITGITGQDGSYLAELLLSKGYEVHGLIRRASTFNTVRIDHLFQDPHIEGNLLHLHYGDMTDSSRLTTLLATIQPDEVYHLAAQSHVRVSFDEPEHTGDVTGLATTRLLEAIRLVSPGSRFYQASSSEMFGATPPPQDERTPFYPRSPYGAAKVYSYWMTKNYREAYGLFASNGILFNHESPRRGETFVTRKITRAAARIKLGLQDKLFLGNLEAIRDWGYATNTPATVADFLEASFGALELDWRKFVEFDSRYLRPTEVDALVGSYEKAKAKLDWEPHVLVSELAVIMTNRDFRLLDDPASNEAPILWRY